ncbi:hypothetical protein [Thermoactinospora rubra]|uniref:hypothetical protein n=1 Tax=Thermoactinospora rubra TaxID=1088767 RepID=UPI00197F64DC|nr:hypothetical protein [Thermoactinospora rubra]
MAEQRHVNIGKQHPTSHKALIASSAEAKESAAAAGLDLSTTAEFLDQAHFP